MNRYRMRPAPGIWKPKLSPRLVRCIRPLRMRNQRRTQRLEHVAVMGAEHVARELAAGSGVLIMPNHPSHADPYSIYAAADTVPSALYVMATWHVFYDQPRPVRWLLRRHGCFSVDREANDIAAFRQAVDILQSRREPLVIFPEGEIYHCNDRVTPFREGAAAIAVAAARRAKRRIVCVPCALRYRYLEDPTEALFELMGELEEAILWRPQTGRPLPERIYRFAGALLAMKELEYFGCVKNGPLPERIRAFGDHLLDQVEQRHGIASDSQSIPERVKAARRGIIEKASDQSHEVSPEEQARYEEDLEELFLVVQSFSYPGDYVEQKPTVERMAETLDKFEEDVLRRPTASIRASRSVAVAFGEPIEVPAERKNKELPAVLSQQVEARVQQLLDAAAH